MTEPPDGTTRPEFDVQSDLAAQQNDSQGDAAPDQETSHAAADRESDADVPDDQEPGEGRDREAAKYRHERNEARTERDRLAATVEVYQRRDAEHLAAQRLQAGSDLWAAGVQLADLLADDGTIDADKLDTVITWVLTKHPHWRTSRGPGTPASLITSNGKPGHGNGGKTPTWQNVFARATGGSDSAEDD